MTSGYWLLAGVVLMVGGAVLSHPDIFVLGLFCAVAAGFARGLRA